MLKLLKNDFIATGRIMGVIYLIMAGVSAVTLLTKNTGGGVISAIGVIILMGMALSLLILTAVFVLVDFHKTLYGDQGYLTFTLPVKSWKILASKVLVSGTWFIIAFAAVIGSVLVMVNSTKGMIGDDYDMYADLVEVLIGKDVESFIGMIIMRIILLFVTFSFLAILIFFTNTLSNTRYFQKHSVLYTILFFAPVAYGTFKLSAFINSKLAFALFFVEGKPEFVSDSAKYFEYYHAGYPPCDISEIIVYLVFGVALFFATHWLMSKKVNIK